MDNSIFREVNWDKEKRKKKNLLIHVTIKTEAILVK